MNLSPTDRDKLQAYLDALEAVPIPQIVDTRIQSIATMFLLAFEAMRGETERAIQ